jgi:hypothetical protein
MLDPKNLPPEAQFLNPKIAAQIIGCSEQTLANNRCKGVGLNFVRFGRLVRYRLSDVLASAQTGGAADAK